MAGPTAGSQRDTVAVGCVFLWHKDRPIGTCTFVIQHHGWKWSWSCSCDTGFPCCGSNKALFHHSNIVTQMCVAGTTQTLEDRAGHALLPCQRVPASRHVCHFFAWLKTKLKRCMNSPTVTKSVIPPPINQPLCACVDRKGVQLNCQQIFEPLLDLTGPVNRLRWQRTCYLAEWISCNFSSHSLHYTLLPSCYSEQSMACRNVKGNFLPIKHNN